MKETQYCPIKSAGFFANPSLNYQTLLPQRMCECDREKCAWWIGKDETCAVCLIALALNSGRITRPSQMGG